MTHIVRLDKEKKGATHGWQVRWRPKGWPPRTYKSKLFSDTTHGGRDKALTAAKKFQTRLEQTVDLAPNERAPYQKTPDATNKTRVVGVRWHQQRARQGLSVYLYAEAHLNIRPYPQAERPDSPVVPHYTRRPFRKRWRVGRYSRARAWQLAVQFRRAYETAEDIGTVQAMNDFLEEHHYSQLINMQFGSPDRAKYDQEQAL